MQRIGRKAADVMNEGWRGGVCRFCGAGTDGLRELWLPADSRTGTVVMLREGEGMASGAGWVFRGISGFCGEWRGVFAG